MSSTINEPPARLKIWVALDASPRSTAALTAAAALAAELDAELAGLFVEDIDLQHLIGLPFAREFSVLTGAGRALSQIDMERSWRREAETLQRLLAEAAGRLRLNWSFHVARGRVTAEVNLLAQTFDLIVLGKRAGIRVMAVTPAPAVTRFRPEVGPVLVLLDERSPGARSLDLGARLARHNGTGLVLLINAESDEGYRARCAATLDMLKEQEMAGRCVRLSGMNGANLIQAVHREHASCLVLAGKTRYLEEAGLERMLDAFECPVVLTQ